MNTEELEIGDEIIGLGTATLIESIERVDEPQPICNIMVEELSNFFVSADSEHFYLVDQGI